ncbi:helix-turn-helix domain-containing protein [Sphingomonas hankyongi]|uniref:Helix-turn-helix domain-containing protein n=1 Tax=Sphingomonas hankyongi TaxID=2908209 RepID=A0ABT0RZY8_9SPHN|nr:helix-turn-helix domain-containing protein [Sphingomonas hankyongi]MCL6729175.1 helix-turn-helix domain-containing protein [Sphingomonas hankyongi]
MDDANVRDRLIDIAARSGITGESRTTIYNRIQSGEITVVKRGRRTFLSESEAYAEVRNCLVAARANQVTHREGPGK